MRRHHAVGESPSDQCAIGHELQLGCRGRADVGEAAVRVAEARAVAREVLQRRQHALGPQPLHEGARVLGDQLRIRPEAPRRADDDRVRRVVADVHHRRQVPVDPHGAQHRADAARFQLRQHEVIRLTELLRRERCGPAGARGQAHDVAAFGVCRDEKLSTRARRRPLRERSGEPSELVGVHDVPGQKHRAADARLAEELVQICIPDDVRATKAHQEQRAQLGLEGRQARGIGNHRGAAAGGEEDAQETSGDEPRQPASPPARDRRAARRRHRA